MRTQITTALLILLAVLSMDSYAQDTPKWATDLLDAWYQAYHSEDAKGLASLYSKDARMPGVRGRDSIQSNFEKDFSESSASCQNDGFEGFKVIGPIAAGWGVDTCEVTPKNGDESFMMTTRWLAIYEQQEDGSWLTIRDFFEVVE